MSKNVHTISGVATIIVPATTDNQFLSFDYKEEFEDLDLIFVYVFKNEQGEYYLSKSNKNNMKCCPQYLDIDFDLLPNGLSRNYYSANHFWNIDFTCNKVTNNETLVPKQTAYITDQAIKEILQNEY